MYKIFFLILFCGVYVKNLEIIFPSTIYLFLMSTVIFFVVWQDVKKISILIAISVSILFLSLIVINAIRGNDTVDGIYFVIYYSHIIFAISCVLYYTLSKNKGVFEYHFVLFCILTNIIGISMFVVVMLNFEYSQIIDYWRFEVISRADTLNDIRSFVFGDPNFPRYNGFYLDPNRWSFCLIVQLVIIDHIYETKRTNFNTTKNIAIFIILISLLISNSRAGIIALMLYYWLSRGKLKFLITTTMFMFIIIIYGVIDGNFFESFYQKITYGINVSSGYVNNEDTGRLSIWYNYLSIIFSSTHTLLFGVSLTLDPSNIMLITPHNIILYTLYQGGLVLLSLLFLFSCKIYQYARAGSKYLSAGFISLSLMTLTEDYLALPIFWFFVFYVIFQGRPTHHHRLITG